MQLGSRKGIQPVKTSGGCGGGVAVSSIGAAPTWIGGASASIFFLSSTKSRILMLAYNNVIRLDLVGIFTCLHKQKVGKPTRNAAQPYTKAESCVYEVHSRADGLPKSWLFQVGIWNVDSLTGRSGKLVEVLGERRRDIACVQDIRWRGSSCRYFGTTGKRYKLFRMGTTTTRTV